MGYCINCLFYVKDNHFCERDGKHSGIYNTCGKYELNNNQNSQRCLLCKAYNAVNYHCSTLGIHKPINHSCEKFQDRYLHNGVDKDYVSFMAGGCNKHEHGTDLYRRCKEWLESIKADDSKIKSIKIIFTQNDYPTVVFWRSFMEKIYKQYDSNFLKNRVAFKGLTTTMKAEALEMKSIILKEKNDAR